MDAVYVWLWFGHHCYFFFFNFGWVLFIPHCDLDIASVFCFTTLDGCYLFLIVIWPSKDGCVCAMTAQGKEGHPCKQLCCAAKFEERAVPITDLFVL